MSSASPTTIVAEYAKSGKSSCKKCSEKIDSKSLRLGLKSRDPRGYDSLKWQHFNCFSSLDSVPVSSVETIQGFSELTGSDQDKLKKMMSEGDQSSTKREGDNETESERRDSKKLKSLVDSSPNPTVLQSPPPPPLPLDFFFWFSLIMTALVAFDQKEKTTHNSHKFGFTLTANNYGYWKAMISPFLVTNSLFGYVDGSIPCPPTTISTTRAPSESSPNPEPVTSPNPQHPIWVANDAHIRMLILSTISESAFQHVQGTTSRDLWLSLERAYAPHTASREYTLKTQLLRIEMKADESSADYLTRAQEYATALSNIGEPMKEKDLVMLVISGLREEYNGLKSTALSRQLVFNELHALLADHEYMLKKNTTALPPAQAFLAAASPNNATASPSQPNSEALLAVQQLAAQLGLQLQLPPQPQAMFAGRQPAGRNRQPLTRRGGGRGGSTRGNSGGNQGGNRFPWATHQNNVSGTCSRCGIGHIPSQCPDRDPATIRNRPPPSSNFSEYRSHASNTWLPDTGSSHHVASNLSNFDSAESYYGGDNLHVGDGMGLPILNIGSSHIRSPTKTFNLLNILHVPNIKQNLLSVQKFCRDNNVYFEFHASYFSVKDTSTHTTLLTGPANDGLYSFKSPEFHSLPKVSFSTTRASATTWHQRLGHPNAQVLNSMLKSFDLPLKNNKSDSFCVSCSVGKSSKLHLGSSTFKSSHILDLVFCDVWGPSPEPSVDGHKYFLLCVDHFSKYMWFFPLKTKSDVFTTFQQFIKMAERQFQTKLKSVQTDWGGEFRNLSPFFLNLGIRHRLSCPHTSEQNGIVERRHRHVVETGLTLLAQSHVPRRFWHFAFDTAVYLINRMPMRSNSSISPFQHIFKHPPDYTFLRVFGSQCFPHLRPYNQNKIDFRSTPCVFLGYSPTHHGYRCLDPLTDRLYISRHVRFNEQCFPFNQPSPPPPDTLPSDPYTTSYPSPIPPIFDPPPTAPVRDPSPPPPQTPFRTYQRHTHGRARTEPTTNQPAQTPPAGASRPRPPNLRQNPKKHIPYNASSFHTSTTEPVTEPSSFTIANNDPKWRQAMEEEYSALIKNGTWSLVPRVQGANVVDCKWLYKLKRDATGAISRYKARLVAKGYRQQPGIDYQETFSPVVKATTIRLVLSIAVTHKWNLRQLDIQNAFLHGDLKETVYLQQPPGFVDPQKPDHVCLLRNNPQAIDQVVQKLSLHFPVQDMGRLAYFLGIEVVHQGSDIILSQQKYINEILQRAGLADAKPVSTPITPSANLSQEDSPSFDNPIKYRQVVGALQYVTLSRPDITYAVNKVCQFMHSPTENHWSTVKRILRYLRGTTDLGLRIQHNSASVLHAYADSANTNVSAFSDADWAGDPDDRRSTGGYAIYLGSNLVSWSARKQKTVSRSSTEAEYKALADTVAEITWLRSLLRELRVKVSAAPVLWCDNLGATYLTVNPIFHARTKHVEVDYHFVREQVARGNLRVHFISTDDQIADVFTKPLTSQRFASLRSKLKTDEDEETGQEKKNVTKEKIVAEYAKSGKSSCKKCSEKIESKSLRLGLSSWDPRGFENTKWHHLECFFPLDKDMVSPESIEGFLELKSSDQEKLKMLVTEGGQSCRKSNEDGETELQRQTDEDEETGQEKKNVTKEKIVAEYAKSGKSSCKKCSEKIESKSLRLGLSSWDPRGFENTKWHHLECFFPLDKDLVSPESIEGFLELKSSDQEKLKKLVTEGGQSSRKSNEDGETELQRQCNNFTFFPFLFSTCMKIVAEYAKSGKSSCKKCSEKIESKSLRLGLSSWDPRGFENTKWHHLECFCLLDKDLVSPESIEGFLELKSSDQEKLKKLMTEGGQSSMKSIEDGETELQRQDEKGKKISDTVEEANGSEIAFAVSDIKDNYKGATLQPKWKAFQTIIYLERDEGLQDSEKIAAFDFDGCLAKTSVQRVGANAWSLMYASIPDKLQSLYNNGYKVVIFTNEANIERWKNKRQVAVDSKIGRLDGFIKLVNVPIQVFIACGVSKGKEQDPFRKPQTGMWRIMEQQFNSGITIDMDKSFYVGDAAGRINDHSDADKKFAETIGLKFYLPEEYFEA
ncbi:hypothetical protein SSX86_005784 [Deinandra increscens subsp. villosa]|uniref:Uncharacterized protein n=1 Tax=Deinandra increscens subsp. villosa TaxID=3103831 RepID=A0AAP0DRN0_9ASTR